MEHAGSRLKRVREKLGLTYRHVEKASQEIAERHQNDEYAIALSRLADIENKGTIPSIFRLYSLCAIYRLDFNDTLRWYGVTVESLTSETLYVPLPNTHVLNFNSPGHFLIPDDVDQEIDFTRTTFLGQFLRQWGKAGLEFLNNADARQYRYGFIGLEDSSMHPVLRPGSLVLIDESRRRIATGWSGEIDRPIYFVEHRDGYRCGWCSQQGDKLLVHAHPSSHVQTAILSSGGYDVVGQVIGVAMRFVSPKQHQTRSATSITASPSP
jgi:transcriptional regulator with XRE-family HTH domain